MRKVYVFALTLVVLSITSFVVAQSPLFNIQDVPAGGGLGRMSGDSYVLDSTFGQVAPGHSQNSQYQLDAGLWAPEPRPLAATPTPGGPSHIYLPVVVRNHPPPPPTPTPTNTPTLTPTATATPTPRPIPGADSCPGEILASTGDYVAQSFERLDDEDWFTFEAQAGVSYRIETADLEPLADTTLELFDIGCGGLLAESQDINFPDNLASRIIWIAPTTGWYHILVRPYDWRVYGKNTGYTLRLERLPSASFVEKQSSEAVKPTVPPRPTKVH